MGVLDMAMRWGNTAKNAAGTVGKALADKAKSIPEFMSPTGEAYENAARSKLGRAAGGVGALVHGANAAGAFNSGDPYALTGHGVMAGLNAFMPTRPIALAADALTGGNAASMISSGLKKADEFMANTFDNERAKTRLAMAKTAVPASNAPTAPATPVGATMPATDATPSVFQNTPTQQLPEAAARAYKDAIDNGRLTSNDMAPGTGLIVSSNGRGTFINSNGGGKSPVYSATSAPTPTLSAAWRELPQAPRLDFSPVAGDRSGFGTAYKIIGQVPLAAQYGRDAKNARFQFEQDKHADAVALKQQDLEFEGQKAQAAADLAGQTRKAALEKALQEQDDKRMKQFMDDTNIHTITQTDPKTGKVSQIADDAKNNDFRNFIRQFAGTPGYDDLTSSSAAKRQARIAEYKQLYDIRDKVNEFAREHGGVTTSGPIGLGKARDYSFARDVLNPGGVGMWNYLKHGGFIDRANNPQVIDTTIPGLDGKARTGQSIPIQDLTLNGDGSINADYVNLLRQISLNNAAR